MSSYSASAATRRGSIVPPLGDVENHTERVPDTCDVLIAGTGLVESVVAAALAWQGTNVIHIDSNDYYGGSSACLSSDELIKWVSKVNQGQEPAFANAKLYIPRPLNNRKYIVDLSPHVMFAKSDLLDLLIKSRVFRYLEFKALGHFHTYENDSFDKVPASKGDIFTDKSLSPITKRGLMKFMKFVLNYGEESGPDHDLYTKHQDEAISQFLKSHFKLEQRQITEIVLTMGLCQSLTTPVKKALPSIRRYLISLDIYGNFPLLFSMYGSGGELSQGFCRSAAVAGAVYKLGVSVQAVRKGSSVTNEKVGSQKQENCVVRLTDGSNVRVTEALIMSSDCKPKDNGTTISRLVAIVAKDCQEWFAENEQAAIVVFPPHTLESDNKHPVQVLVMGSGSGQCPEGQAMWYLSSQEQNHAKANIDLETALKKLEDAILRESAEDFELNGLTENDLSYRPDGLPILNSVKLGQSLSTFVPKEKLQNVLKLSYTQRVSNVDFPITRTEQNVVEVPSSLGELSYDGILQRARAVYTEIVGSDDDFFDVDFEDEDELADSAAAEAAAAATTGASAITQPGDDDGHLSDKRDHMDMEDEFGHDMEL